MNNFKVGDTVRTTQNMNILLYDSSSESEDSTYWKLISGSQGTVVSLHCELGDDYITVEFSREHCFDVSVKDLELVTFSPEQLLENKSLWDELND